MPEPMTEALAVVAGEDPATRAGRLAREVAAAPEGRAAAAVMLAARRLYALAFEAVRASAPGVDADAVAEVFAAAIAAEAARPFEPADLVPALAEGVAPWLAAEVGRRAEGVAGARREALADLEAARRAAPVVLASGALTLARDRPLLVAGDGPALYALFDLLAAEADAAGLCVVRMIGYDGRRPATPPDGVNFVRVPPRAWAGAARTRDGWPRVAGRHVLPRLSAPPDLLLCDDAPAAAGLIAGGRPATAANEALRRLGAWAAEAGCALALGLPGDEPSAATVAHADLAAVAAVDDGGGIVRLRLDPPGATWDVAEDDYAAYRPRLILGGR